MEQLPEQLIDVTDWARYEEYTQYPEGKCPKALLYCVDKPLYTFLKPNHQYLFKRARSVWCPEQFWTEIFAYRLGLQMSVPVTPTFVAYDSQRKQSGALVEWVLPPPKTFLSIIEQNNELSMPLSSQDETLIAGGRFFEALISDFDQRKGTQHNFQTIVKLFESWSNDSDFILNDGWKSYWAKIFTFDALIGNIDRHQDNWKIIITTNYHNNDMTSKQRLIVRMSPIFDNGASMGYEVSSDNFNAFDFENYIRKGCHHILWSFDKSTPPKKNRKGVQHAEMLKKISNEYPEIGEIILNCLKQVSYDNFNIILNDLVKFELPDRLTRERANFMLELLHRRHQSLLSTMEK
ncbi:MAG: hypothetical protein HKM04_03810 [Legionellales bacterium]|nr:hypothetical protein [Legionellales bacterium]